ncbi:cytochrome P450 [Cryptosporangium phraense]|uniref:Cytochrome P450 n=1 Tax=Cryptosporangium phraense TaxID=2593070 RepID=A0A545B085_9ACTN|nr:cytochrome P450 [Cryptosporangium phraense]TQS46981.1 cytochrome P450 [Cryptosporangium phraense]
MTIDDARETDPESKPHRINLDRHSSRYRTEFEELSNEFHGRCPVAWNETHGGYWFTSGNKEVFDIARRADVLSNENDPDEVKRRYWGISIPPPPRMPGEPIGGFLEMDPPEQRHYRQALNPYLSPAAVVRWQPVMDEITRACLDEKIESGRIDFVDDLANVVPAVVTMAMLGMPLEDWIVHCEPAHATIYTRPDSPEIMDVFTKYLEARGRTSYWITEIRKNPRPGLIDALIKAEINGAPASDRDILGAVQLLIGGGFDTTTALTAHALEWLSENPAERSRLSADWENLRDSATEEFLRFYTPAQGDGRTIAVDAEIDGVRFREGERLWLSWAMANRDETVFEDPHTVHLDRKGNRHSSFGLGIHRCIGSNVARATFKTMIRQVLDRMPDFVCQPDGAVHYDTTGVINGMKNLPATFTPGPRIGAGLDETIARMQAICDEQRLAEPVTVRKAAAKLGE